MDLSHFIELASSICQLVAAMLAIYLAWRELNKQWRVFNSLFYPRPASHTPWLLERAKENRRCMSGEIL